MYSIPTEYAPNAMQNPLIKNLPDKIIIPSLRDKLFSVGINIESLEECRDLIDSMPLHCLTNNKRIQSINDNRFAARLKRKEQEEFNTKHLLTGLMLGLPSYELLDKDNTPAGAKELFWTLPYHQKKVLIVSWLLLGTGKNIFTMNNLFNFLSVNKNNKKKKILITAFYDLIKSNFIEKITDPRRIEKLTGKIKPSGKIGPPVKYYMMTRSGAQLLKPYLLAILKQTQDRTGLLFDNDLISKTELLSKDFLYNQNV